MTKAKIERLKELAQKAIPGPWAYRTDAEKYGAKYPDSNWVYANLHPQDDHVYGILLSVNHNLKLCDTTAAFIAAANPQVILELIADYERLAKENEELRANNYGPEILNDPQALTVSYFAGRMAEGREKDREMDKVLNENRRLEKEIERLKAGN